MTRRPSEPLGFTLLELMVTLAIAAILMVVAVPGFLAFQRSSMVFSAASSFSAALNAARAEAMKNARTAYVVPLTGTDWSQGWRVYVDMNKNDTYDSGTDVLVLTQPPLPTGVSVPITTAAPGFVDGTVAYVRYNAYGIPSSVPSGALPLPNGVDFMASAGSQVTKRRVMVGAVGRPRTCDPLPAADPTGTCTLAVP